MLGDQLTPSLSALRDGDRARDIILLMEVAEETRYVRHHRKKIALILAAMRAFASELKAAGWRVDYVKLEDPESTGSFTGEVARAIARHKPRALVATLGGEHRVRQAQRAWGEISGLPVDLRDDDRFLCSEAEFAAWAGDRTSLRMEFFYREMRKKTGLLMDSGAPVGGKWNFDAENRKRAEADLFLPQPPSFEPDAETRDVLELVNRLYPDHFGDLEPFWFAVRREDAQKAARHFMKQALPRFGDFQDAMLRNEKFLYHSILSPLLNIGLLDPLDLCRQAEAEFRAGRAPLNAVEGFIRQIIGWREYVRGIYWLKGPDYLASNALNASRALPAFYWTGDTKMACMAATIGQTKQEAYAHHIQRLMVTGNFALLADINPHELHEWYLAVYADAFEWVEAPNTIGMSQFADGGLLASKPYAASGAYIARMSDYCESCTYNVKERTGEDACPFNALYWRFIARHRNRFAANPRMGPILRNFDRMDDATRSALLAKAERTIAALDMGDGAI